MSLTAKQEQFCVLVTSGLGFSEAYREVYNASNMKPDSVNRKAKELMDNVKITARLAELRKPAIEAAQMTLTQHLNDLKALRDKADAAEKYGPAIQAEVARGKASGLYVEKVEHSGSVGIEGLYEAITGKTDALPQ